MSGFVRAVVGLALGLQVGGIAVASAAAFVLFDRAPNREIAGHIGMGIFELLAAVVLALTLIVLAGRLFLRRGEPASRASSAGLVLAVACCVLALAIALWLTPQMARIWESAPHAADGAGLTGEDRRRFMALHGIGNLAYQLILVMGAAQVVLGTARRRVPASVAGRAARVKVFLYGSYMNADVLAQAGLAPGRLEVAQLHGFDIEIRPLANLVRAEGARVYGLLAEATHEELERLYAHARHVLGATYLPHPVLVKTGDGPGEPALCYIAAALRPGPAEADYVERILGPARRHGFPAWYIERLESFRPSGS